MYAINLLLTINNKKLSCHKETVQLLCGSVLAKCNWDWETTFCHEMLLMYQYSRNIAQWCASRHIQLNADKTEVIWFCSDTNI